MTTEAVPISVRATVLDAIAEIARTAPAADSRRQTFEELGVDSLDFVRLVQILEDRLGITLSDDQASALATVEELVALCETVVDGKTA